MICIENAKFLCILPAHEDDMSTLLALHNLPPGRFETPAILKKLAAASRALAELKGVAASIPNQGILVNTLGMQSPGVRLVVASEFEF